MKIVMKSSRKLSYSEKGKRSSKIVTKGETVEVPNACGSQLIQEGLAMACKEKPEKGGG